MSAATEQAIDPQHFIKLMKARDIRAMEILYDHYSSVIYGVIFWITNDEKKAEEVLYKTFTYIWNHFSTFDESVHNICFWMVSIARRFSFESLSPEDCLKMSQHRQAMAKVAQRKHEEVLNDAFFSGMNVQKMAEKFGCAESKIRTLLQEAIDQLKKEYVAR